MNKLIGSVTPEYRDIAPAKTSSGSKNQYIRFSKSSPSNTYANFRLDIVSNGYIFWSDIFKVLIYPTSFREMDGKHKISLEFVLHQNYPNPFNSPATIIYSIPEPARAILKVYDLIGREIQTLVNKFVEAGTHSANFDASNLPRGMYIYKLQAGDLMEARKMSLMR